MIFLFFSLPYEKSVRSSGVESTTGRKQGMRTPDSVIDVWTPVLFPLKVHFDFSAHFTLLEIVSGRRVDCYTNVKSRGTGTLRYFTLHFSTPYPVPKQG